MATSTAEVQSIIPNDTIMHPLSGELVGLDNIDGMAEMLSKVKSQLEQLRTCEWMLRAAVAALARGEGKTLRVRGERYRLKVELPDDSWNNAQLKAAWNRWPELAPKFLRIEAVAPQLREIKKLANESGPPDFELFKASVLGANEGPKGVARVTIEEDGDGGD